MKPVDTAAPERNPDKRVEPLELFFDLVFVFAFTQVKPSRRRSHAASTRLKRIRTVINRSAAPVRLSVLLAQECERLSDPLRGPRSGRSRGVRAAGRLATACSLIAVVAARRPGVLANDAGRLIHHLVDL